MVDRALDRVVERRLTAVVRRRLVEEPVIAVHGPRSVGKSTLLRQIATGAGRSVVDLDDPAVRDAVNIDPGLFAAGPSPVIVDEFQRAPIILDAIKAELNRRLEPGRFLLAGSTSYSSLPRAAQALTGRLHQVNLWPLSQGELDGVNERFVEAILTDPAALVSGSPSSTTRREYVARVVRGGLPLPLSRPAGPSRARWYHDYLRQVIERDVIELSRIRQRDRLPRLLARLAAQTGQVLSIANAARDAGIEQRTAENYVQLLESVFLLDRLPAWGRTLRSRVSATAKVHIVDTGLAAHVLGLTVERLERADPAALAEFGHLLETFAVIELRKQCSWLEVSVGLGHWRTHDGDEVDLILERTDGGVVAIECKATARVRESDFGSLMRLRGLLGDLFVGGIVLHLGERAFTASDRLHALPLDRLWMP